MQILCPPSSLLFEVGWRVGHAWSHGYNIICSIKKNFVGNLVNSENYRIKIKFYYGIERAQQYLLRCSLLMYCSLLH